MTQNFYSSVAAELGEELAARIPALAPRDAAREQTRRDLFWLKGPLKRNCDTVLTGRIAFEDRRRHARIAETMDAHLARLWAQFGVECDRGRREQVRAAAGDPDRGGAFEFCV